MDREIYALKEFYRENLFVSHNITRPRDYEMKSMHFHDGYEIWLSMSDGAKYVIENETYEANRGALFLVNNMEMHKSIAPQDCDFERFVVSFVPEYLVEYENDEHSLLRIFTDKPQGGNYCILLTEEQIDEFLKVIEMIQRFTTGDYYGKEQLKKHALAQLIILCNGYYNHAERFLVVETAMRLKPIIGYIREHIDESLSLLEIADKFYLSKMQLYRLFKTGTGMPPNEYIIMTRILKARPYLAEGMPIIKVCEMIGYSDESHFIRTFKRVMGITPKQYGKLKMKSVQ